MSGVPSSEALAYESTIPWHGQHSDKLVIHCSDSRYQASTDEFLRTGLKLKSFDRLVVPGGPAVFLAASHFPKFEWAGRRWARFLAKHHETREIICLAHEDCGWYKEITIGPFSLSLVKNRQLDDLRKVPEVLREMLPEAGVRLFYACPNSQGRVEFRSV
jgi:hypothetical protein